MQRTHTNYEITDDPTRVDFSLVHRWLTGTYWCAGISQPKVEKAAQHSALVISAYVTSPAAPQQVAYCRVVSDQTRFAWLADVFVDPDHRGQGLGRAMVRFALDHPQLADVHYWLLGTRDAHGVYKELGFNAPDSPDRFMQLKRPPSL